MCDWGAGAGALSSPFFGFSLSGIREGKGGGGDWDGFLVLAAAAAGRPPPFPHSFRNPKIFFFSAVASSLRRREEVAGEGKDNN